MDVLNSLPKKEKSLVKTCTFLMVFGLLGFSGHHNKGGDDTLPWNDIPKDQVSTWKISHGISGGRMDGLFLVGFGCSF